MGPLKCGSLWLWLAFGAIDFPLWKLITALLFEVVDVFLSFFFSFFFAQMGSDESIPDLDLSADHYYDQEVCTKVLSN